MDNRLLKTLEFEKVLDRLSKYAESTLGKNKISKMRPSRSKEQAEEWQEETERAIDLFLAYGAPPLFGIRPIAPLAKRASLGGILSASQLLEISESLRVSRALIHYAREADPGSLVSEIRSLFVQEGLEETISRAIDPDGKVLDTASSELYRIRRAIQKKENETKEKLGAIMAQAFQNGYLRENLVTVRDGRYVLPVKSQYRGTFKGLVHDQSSSGATVFMEPLAVVELNNAIRQLESEEKEEIQRILASLSADVGEYAEELSANQKKLQNIDMAFAKAKYAIDLHGSRPVFTSNRQIHLIEARHPLLEGKVVPIDFSLGRDFNTLIITGPNTGGKTVSLKTVGLIQLMAQAGLQIPCKSPSTVGVFESIYADIGDQQSIELSLSTFSASMSSICDILKKADQRSLVLFDELGAGTDPVEGAALAMAILSYMTERDIRTVATTHYAELKLFAIKKERVQNASVEFDVKTLSPTYKLMIGLPGRSNAFEISKRLGLPDFILSDAQNRVKSENIKFEDVLADIEKSRKESEEKKLAMERQAEEYAKKLKAMQKDLERAQKQFQEQKEEAKEESRELIRQAKETAQELIREAKKAQNRTLPELDRALNAVNEKAREMEDRVKSILPSSTRKKASADPEQLKIGDQVEIISLGQSGVLVAGPDASGEVQVQMGILKLHSHIADLCRIEEPERSEEKRSPMGSFVSQKANTISPELDLRGERFADAMDRVDKYLDDAVIAGLNDLRIIHGKGTGALKKGVSDLLSHDPRVKSYCLADPKEGGAGVTLVHLK